MFEDGRVSASAPRTGLQVGRGFKQLLNLNDQELFTIFEELGDEFLLQVAIFQKIQEINVWIVPRLCALQLALRVPSTDGAR